MNSIYLQVAGSQPLSKLMIYHTEITVEAIVAMVGLEPGTHYFFDTFLGSKWVWFCIFVMLERSTTKTATSAVFEH